MICKDRLIGVSVRLFFWKKRLKRNRPLQMPTGLKAGTLRDRAPYCIVRDAGAPRVAPAINRFAAGRQDSREGEF